MGTRENVMNAIAMERAMRTIDFNRSLLQGNRNTGHHFVDSIASLRYGIGQPSQYLSVASSQRVVIHAVRSHVIGHDDDSRATGRKVIEAIQGLLEHGIIVNAVPIEPELKIGYKVAKAFQEQDG
jgi:hypothetical protein